MERISIMSNNDRMTVVDTFESKEGTKQRLSNRTTLGAPLAQDEENSLQLSMLIRIII